MPPKVECKNCKFWNGEGAGWGKCHRCPPHFEKYNSYDDRWWPETKEADWCGEGVERV